MVKIMSKVERFIRLLLFYGFARGLPKSDFPYLGKISNSIRSRICRPLLAECGKNVNIEHGANIGSGRQIRIGDNSGLGENSVIGGPILIGKEVMMAPDVVIYRTSHRFDRTEIPMHRQGKTDPIPLEVCDDVWFAHGVFVLPGCRRIGKGAVIAAGAVVTKHVPDYAVVGGNPAKVLKMRTSTHDIANEPKLTLPSGIYGQIK